jgi:hypothetical protein
MGLAVGHAALRAARRLLGRLGLGEVAIDLEEVVAAVVRVTLLGHVAADLDELEHLLGGHGASS